MEKIVFLTDILNKTKQYDNNLEEYIDSIEKENPNQSQCTIMLEVVVSMLVNYMKIKKFTFDVYDYNLDEMNMIRMRCKFLCAMLMMRISLLKIYC